MEIINNRKSKKLFLSGISKLCDAVKITLGPLGKNVILESDVTLPIITNDGATIASHIELNNNIENIACSVLKESSLKTNDIVGDGTTTSLVLSESIFKHGLLEIKKGYNPMKLKKEFEIISSYLEKQILDSSKKIKNIEEIVAVAAISSESKEIGEIIGDIVLKIGMYGTIFVEESNKDETSVDIIEGMKIESGYISSYMCENDTFTSLENTMVLVTDKKIETKNDMEKILSFIDETKSLIIIAEDIVDDALSYILLAKLNLGLNVVAVKAPSYGAKRKEILKDICVYTGSRYITKDLGISLNNIKYKDFGSSKLVKVFKDYTVLVGIKNTILVDERKEIIEKEILNENSEFEREFLENRLANLTGGIAFINVGAPTNTERLEKKLRIDDAVNAVKASYKYGVVAGGGIIYLNLLKELNNNYNNDASKRILVKSLPMPFIQIINNCGYSGKKELKKILKENNNIGYDVISNKKVNMIQNNIIDPAYVCISALKNAISASSILLTTEKVVLDKSQIKNKSKKSFEEI